IADNGAYRLLTKSRPFLLHLNFRGCNKLTIKTFSYLNQCKNIQDLNLSRCLSINDQAIEQICKGCKILIYLNISYTNIGNNSIRSIANNLKNILYLSLSFCRNFDDTSLEYYGICSNFYKILYLDIAGCCQITETGLNGLSHQDTSLESLIINHLPRLSDRHIEKFLRKCKNLKNISLINDSDSMPNLKDDYWPIITEKTFYNLSKSCASLRKLEIEGNYALKDKVFHYLQYGSLHILTHLYIVDCINITDAGVKLISSFKNLVYINLSDCVKITDNGVKSIVDGSSSSKLVTLILAGCYKIGDTSIMNINKKCHKIKTLKLGYCKNITISGIELLGLSSTLSSIDLNSCNITDQCLSKMSNNKMLCDMNISFCSEITDLGVQKFSKQMEVLEKLDISHCMNVTDVSIKNVAFSCRMLTVINLAGCKQLTNLSIQYLAGVCHYIQVINISGSLYITDKYLKQLPNKCRKLHTLIALYCRNITKKTIIHLKTCIENVIHSNASIPMEYMYEDTITKRHVKLSSIHL
ncbi:hypothetical protein A3Q56_07819, partial [Intoshia linei]